MFLHFSHSVSSPRSLPLNHFICTNHFLAPSDFPSSFLLCHFASPVFNSFDPSHLCPFFFPSSWPIPQLEPSQIRLIVYQDCERRGRNVLFDSSAKKRGTEETPITVSHKFVLCVCVLAWKPFLGFVDGNEKTLFVPSLVVISGLS